MSKGKSGGQPDTAPTDAFLLGVTWHIENSNGVRIQGRAIAKIATYRLRLREIRE